LEKDVKIASLINSAICVTLEIDSRQYRGDVTALKINEHIMFKVSETDDELARISIDHGAMYLRVMMAQGGFNLYRTRLMKKKIPLLQLKFPEEECRSPAKERSILSLDMGTTITVLNRDGGVIKGVGIIHNISECGVYLNTGLELIVGDRIGFYLGFQDSGKESPLELTGEVKRTIDHTPPRDIGSYGVRFTGIDIRTLRKVRAFIKPR